MPCDCAQADAPAATFTPWRRIGVDKTAGRFAEVEVLSCCKCGDLWLRYAVEYEGASRSGRWARGRVEADKATSLSPQGAPAHLESLPDYVFGGSYFGGTASEGSGPMPWGP